MLFELFVVSAKIALWSMGLLINGHDLPSLKPKRSLPYNLKVDPVQFQVNSCNFK